MKTYTHAMQLLVQGDRAVCILTDGTLLEIKPDGTGETGNWKMSGSRKFDRVLIFCWRDGATKADLYLARPDGRYHPEKEPERYVVKLKEITLAGTTSVNWKAFANTGQYPIRYLDWKVMAEQKSQS